MPHLKSILTRLFTAREGASAIEYALMAALIAIAMVPALKVVTDGNNQRADKTAHALAGAPEQ